MIWFGIIIGFLIGIIVSPNREKVKKVGILRVDHSDQDGPYLFVELECPIKELERLKTVEFEVMVKNYLS